MSTTSRADLARELRVFLATADMDVTTFKVIAGALASKVGPATLCVCCALGSANSVVG